MADKNDRLGALWAKTSAKGDYFTGTITIGGVTTKLVVFANRFKENDTQPDWVICKSVPKEA